MQPEEKLSERWVGGLSGIKGKYLKTLCSAKRDGISALATYLNLNTDFFTAPGSANGHNNYGGGLVEHSLAVFDNAQKLAALYLPQKDMYESLVIAALLHDVCKINFYKESTRNVKVGSTWIQEPYFSIEDALPLGHGEKSVIIIQPFIYLTPEEIMAIRWHMMGFDDSVRSYAGGLALTNAVKKYPLITILHMADLAACYLEAQE